jgi:hypothetical protein
MSRVKTSPEVLRGQARSEAEKELNERGGIVSADGVWEIILDLGTHGQMSGKAVLPADFPDELPEISIDRAKLVRRIPHVERSGKICLAPSTGVLLDATAPRQLVRDSLKRAESVLVDGLSGSNKDDLLEEFSAYWNAEICGSISSICEASAESRIVELVDLVHSDESKRLMTLAADEFEEAKTWASRAGWRIRKRDKAFFMQIESAFEPPDFEESISTNELLEIILQSTVSDSSDLMKRWLWTKSLPAYVLMSIPLLEAQGYVVIAARLEAAMGESKQRAQRGFRPGHLPAAIETRFTRKTPVSRIEVRRLDSDYLLPRGGGSKDLLSRTVALVGCGAIGSNVAKNLASLGIGTIRLIDPDTLMPENIHRHALGASFIDKNKAEGMRLFLNRHYPHIRVEDRPEKVQTILHKEPGFITDADLVIIALGDETLELHLNDVFGDRMPRVHAWVEPLGIGGHLLATGLSDGTGCFRCLFDIDEFLGIHNQSAFAAPGQKFQPSFSGCAGTFTPFAGIDADRAANEAASLTSRILLRRERENLLVSWRGQDDDFFAAGFKLSERGKMVRVGEKRIETRFARKDCISCGQSTL